MATSRGKGQQKSNSNTLGFLEKAKASKTPPIGSQIKKAVDLLRETRRFLTQEEIIEACGVGKAVFDHLKKNPRISSQGNYYSYKAKYELSDAADLISLLQKFPDGINVAELADSYPNVAQDLKELKETNKMYVLTNESRQEIAYPNGLRYHDFKVDDALKKLYRDITLPLDFVEVADDLKKDGMKPATNTKRRMAMAEKYQISDPKDKKKKKGQISSRTKLTNAHLPELFRM